MSNNNALTSVVPTAAESFSATSDALAAARRRVLIYKSTSLASRRIARPSAPLASSALRIVTG
eukprot:12936989-Prorocentrum_lima.AAC.1